MVKVTVVYFSSSGQTKRIAELLAADLRRRDMRVLMTPLEDARQSDLLEADAILAGSPAWTGETVVEPLEEFLSEAGERLRGKRVGFFGSYDWGEGRYFDRLTDQLGRLGVAVCADPLLECGRVESLSPEEATRFIDDVLGPTFCRPRSQGAKATNP